MRPYPEIRDRWTTRAGEWLSYAIVRGVEVLTRRVDLWWLARSLGRAAALVVPVVPVARRRIEENLALVRPGMPPAERRRLVRGVADSFVRLMVEYMHLRRFVVEARIETEGAAVVEAALLDGRGAVIVTAHYGNWEAVRIACLRLGLECGIIYRAFNNRYLDRHTLGLISAAGEPVLQKGPRGMRALRDHVAAGGTAMVLVDQRTTGAPLIPFLGVPAETVTVAALLSLRTGAPLIPAVGRREGGHGRFLVRFEEPVAPAEAREMMAEVNRRIGAWIEEAPEQWFWFHRRWRRGAERGRGAAQGRPASA